MKCLFDYQISVQYTFPFDNDLDFLTGNYLGQNLNNSFLSQFLNRIFVYHSSHNCETFIALESKLVLELSSITDKNT